MLPRPRLLGAAALLAPLAPITLLTPHAAAQNLAGNPSFETPSAGGSFTNRSGPNAMAPWSVGGDIDQIGGFWQAAQGNQSVDLNGSTAGAVWQTIATTPGARYHIRYALSENFYGYGDKTMDVSWAGAVIHSDTVTHNPARTPTNMLWSYVDLDAIAPSASTVIMFTSTTGAMNGAQGFTTYYGPAIDDITVEPAPCGSADFNCDGDVGTDADIEAFFACLAGNCPPPPCAATADFNGDGDTGTDADIEAFFRVLAGGSC